ncbi:MAG: class I SAM-dependent methyltransferase [Sciscionella sp.]
MRPNAVHRALDAELTAAMRRRAGAAPRVLDVGGGTGVWAVPMAQRGCHVTVVEPSPNALATLQRRAADAGVADRITAVQGDTEALARLVPEREADLVLGHGVLEVVDDLPAAVAALVTVTAPGGAVSVLVANRYAAVLHRALSGHLEQARSLLNDPHGTLPVAGESLLRRFDSESVQLLLAGAGLAVELMQGDDVLSGVVPGSALEDPKASDVLAELELAVSSRSPLRDIASRLHVLARRPG